MLTMLTNHSSLSVPVLVFFLSIFVVVVIMTRNSDDNRYTTGDLQMFAIGGTDTISSDSSKITPSKAADIPLVRFDDPDNLPIWTEMDDPVMGGRSQGEFIVHEGYGLFRGEVVNVPFLEAPGFIQADLIATFPDIRHCKALAITCHSSTKYDGYKISFGRSQSPGCGYHGKGYKAALDVPRSNRLSSKVHRVVIPFSKFSDCNDDGTGLPIRTCEEDPSTCPDDETLMNVEILKVWGEGVAGKLDLEILSIDATECE